MALGADSTYEDTCALQAQLEGTDYTLSIQCLGMRRWCFHEPYNARESLAAFQMSQSHS